MNIHIVQSDETLTAIAKMYNVDYALLIKLNPQIATPDIINPGMKVRIPNGSAEIKDKAFNKMNRMNADFTESQSNPQYMPSHPIGMQQNLLNVNKQGSYKETGKSNMQYLSQEVHYQPNMEQHYSPRSHMYSYCYRCLRPFVEDTPINMQPILGATTGPLLNSNPYKINNSNQVNLMGFRNNNEVRENPPSNNKVHHGYVNYV